MTEGVISLRVDCTLPCEKLIADSHRDSPGAAWARINHALAVGHPRPPVRTTLEQPIIAR
jgi:hypothetical protein